MQTVSNNKADELVRLYKRAEKEIINLPLGRDLIDIAQKQTLLYQIRLILESLQSPTDEFLQEELQKEWNLGIKVANRALGLSFNLIDPEAVNAIFDLASQDVKTALANSYQRIERALSQLSQEQRQKVLLETGKALVTGQARRDLAKNLADYLRDNGLTGFSYVDKAGRNINISLEQYVRGLTLDAMRNANTSAVITRSIQAGNDLVIVSTHGGDESPMCKPYGGKILSISGKDKRYPSLEYAQRWYKGLGVCNHRYCKRRLTPYIETDIQFN